MSDKDPEYTNSSHSYQKRIATRCRICGRQLLLPEEAKQEVHKKCVDNYKPNTYGMG